MPKKLVFVGGGHAHLTALTKVNEFVAKGHDVTLISPVTHHYYSGMGPGMLSQMYAPNEVRFHISKMVNDRGGKFIQAKVVGIDAEKQVLQLDDNSEFAYDVVSFNTGSSVPADHLNGIQNVFPVKPIVNLLKAQRAILNAIKISVPRVAVIGGGPAGVELAGNLEGLIARNGGKGHISLVAGSRVLKNFPEKVIGIVERSFKNRNIDVINSRFKESSNGSLILENGNKIDVDFVFSAVGVKPSSLFASSNLPTGQDGALLVNNILQSLAYPNIFGGGDCIALKDKTLDKVGVYAVRQNPILVHNLMVALQSGEMEKFIPQDTYLLIFNLGDGTGIFVRKTFVWNGRIAFFLKNYIDTKFMKKFQVSGERFDNSEILD
jgi:NADH dehydrogenase FAD-containing subunit